MKIKPVNMSKDYVEKCPNCGNIVEGKVKKTYTNKVARQGAKSAVHMATGMGVMGTGAAALYTLSPIKDLAESACHSICDELNIEY